jgi:hypothetical protein
MNVRRNGQNARELALRKYFKGLPEKPNEATAVVLMVAGGGAAFLGLVVYFATKDQFGFAGCGQILSVLMAFGGVAMLMIGAYQRNTLESSYEQAVEEVLPQPTDQEVDTWFSEGLRHVIQQSRAALNLLEQEIRAEPLVIVAPSLAKTDGIDRQEITFRRGADNGVRFSVYTVAVIHLTERHLGAYRCDFNFIRDVALNETTQEYHYLDIVSVTTAEKSCSYRLPTSQKLTTFQQFQISVASGECFSVPLNVEEIRKMTGVEDIPQTGTDKAVRAIRTFLRDKKGDKQAETYQPAA